KPELSWAPLMPLTKEIVARRKTGFVVPVREWMLERPGSRARGLRGWARIVYQNLSNAKRALVLVSDAYGGYGGIAKFNRDLLASCAADIRYSEVIALPRVISGEISEWLPEKLRYESVAANGKMTYTQILLSTLIANRRFDVVVCGHLNLLPLAWLACRISGAPLAMAIYGIEAWQPTARWLVNRLAGKIDYLISISETTKERFQAWAHVSAKGTFILPCSVDTTHFHPDIKNPQLVDR